MADDTYPPEHGWTCFHCGETFKTPGGARDHFGATPESQPGCVLKVGLGEERGLLMALRKIEEDMILFRSQRDKLEEDLECTSQSLSEFISLVLGARTTYDVRCHLDHLDGRAAVAELAITTMQKMLDAVQTDECAGESDFATGVNSACKRHTEGLRNIMTAAGFTPRPEVPCDHEPDEHGTCIHCGGREEDSVAPVSIP